MFFQRLNASPNGRIQIPSRHGRTTPTYPHDPLPSRPPSTTPSQKASTDQLNLKVFYHRKF